MQFTIAQVLAIMPFFAALSHSTPLPVAVETRSHPSHSAEIFYLSNCFGKGSSTAEYAEFDYYYNRTLSVVGGHPVAPDMKNIIGPSNSVDYEDGTWTSLPGSPFNLTATIGVGTAGTVVGSAISSTFTGTMKCEKLVRVVPYQTSTYTCYSDYACVDSGTALPQ